jgi:molybdate transport system substrate-binding protein
VRRNPTGPLALFAVSMLLAAGCGSDGSPSTTSASALEGTIIVSAAASLRDAFDRIGDDFSAANPDVGMTFSFDSSSTLSTQIIEGAPADVYASADEANMTRLTDERLITGDPAVFARNELVIVTVPGNPEAIATLADLADVGVVALCGEDVPCGRYAGDALRNAGVRIDESSVTRGQNVTATLTAVAQGDAAAGIVYATDAVAAGDTVEAVPIPADANVIATYPIGALGASGDPEVAEAFVAHVLGEEGQAVLAEFGFLPPT